MFSTVEMEVWIFQIRWRFSDFFAEFMLTCKKSDHLLCFNWSLLKYLWIKLENILLNKSYCYLAITTQLTTRVTHINSPVAPKPKHTFTIASFSLHSCAHTIYRWISICCCWEYLYTRSKIHSKEVFTREWNLIFFPLPSISRLLFVRRARISAGRVARYFFGCDFFFYSRFTCCLIVESAQSVLDGRSSWDIQIETVLIAQKKKLYSVNSGIIASS